MMKTWKMLAKRTVKTIKKKMMIRVKEKGNKIKIWRVKMTKKMVMK